MEIRGTNNTPRADVDRASDSRKSEQKRRAGREVARDGEERVEGDRVETGASRLVDEAVDRTRRATDERADQVRSRREELLKKADDPEAIRRAARGLLGLEPDHPGVFDEQPSR